MISETGLNVELIKHLSWRLSFQTSYDSKPADMVRKFDQKFEQSLAIRF
jgi:putative salt-induced outer membrane protein YdiY